MGEIVNLRRVKKARLRDEAAQHAAENRARTGVSKTARAAQAQHRKLSETQLDGARLLPLCGRAES